ncbi:MAG TPA: transaldolase, partial [Longimicrobiales bacterium]|nr:transaldolase [Longimicrobiales bacterium]
MTSNPLLRLQEHDQAFWLDNLTREKVRSGELARRVREEGLRGITTNPAIVQKALAGDDSYGVQVAGLASEGRTVREIYDAIVVEDVRAACEVLRPVYEETDGRDGYVSLEVSPYLAYDPEGSLAEARRYVAAVDRPNLMIKIPGTAAAIPAIEQALYEGINVNITLLFSVKRSEQVARAYVDALRRRLRERQPISSLASVASFFLSRIDVLADRMLAHRIRTTRAGERDPRPQDLLGRVAIENARHAYRVFERVFRGATWERLAEAGARPQRLLWASTGNKNPLYDDLRYVEPLIGPQTVDTMPDATAAEFRRRGRVARTLRVEERHGRDVADRLADVGLDLEDITNRLEVEAVQKFLDPLDRLLARIAEMREGGPPDVAEAAAGVVDVDGLLDHAQEQRLGVRLFAGDEALFAPPPEGRAPALLRAPELLLQRLAEVRDFADELRTDFHEVVIVASGECAALSRLALGLFPPGPDGPRVDVLDPTAADADGLLEPAWGPRAFLVIGPALDRSEALDRVLTLLEPRGVESPEFAVVAGEGSALARAVVERGFRRVLASPPELATGSALSYEGLVPLALLGVDVEEVVRRAIEMRRSCAPEVPVRANPALRLGCVLGGLAARG